MRIYSSRRAGSVMTPVTWAFPRPARPLRLDLERDFMKKEMLINVSQPEECRIAIVEDGVLEELYIERSSQDNYVGNIYKGKVVNIEPSIQAAFVDFGVGRNGFLHISDVEPQYFRQGGYDPDKALGDDDRPARRSSHRNGGPRDEAGRDSEGHDDHAHNDPTDE